MVTMNPLNIPPYQKGYQVPTKPGIYLVMDATGYVKIGRSDVNMKNRVKSIKTDNPSSSVLQVYPMRDGHQVDAEKLLHTTFRERRIRGEWFDLGSNPIYLVETALKELGISVPPYYAHLQVSAPIGRVEAPLLLGSLSSNLTSRSQLVKGGLS